ncbi:MAG: hypothetical protein IPK32_09800 [Verrucomicrobiaceae bacterium]|nr:hypothetical protein [Verrucomicrobiaceae bacterium]
MVQGNDGNFYGTTSDGGNGNGTVFKMTPAGVLTTLVEFTGNGAGSSPQSSLVQGSDGNFYGTTHYTNYLNGNGTLFRMTPAGALTTLIQFTGNGATNKGKYPDGGLMQDSDGTFYGTTYNGGASDFGTVFKMTAAGVLTTLVEFAASEEGHPNAALLRGLDGNLYGTTSGPDGSIYRLILPGAPLVSISNVPPEGSTSAVVEAKINARGAATIISLEYGTDGVTFSSPMTVASNLTGFQSKLVGSTLVSLTPGRLYYYRFRAVSSAGTTVSPVASFFTLVGPTVTTTSASALAPTSARFNGTVNAGNYDSTVIFEWGTDGNLFPNQVPSEPGTVTGSTAVPVSVPVAGLVKGTTYYYRIIATNAAGTVVSGTQSFRTLTEPTAVIGGNFALTTTSVRVEGSVNAQGSDSSVVFEYGTDGVSFPNSVAATPGTVTGQSSSPVSAVLTTLSQGATYHYRIRATSAGGVGTSSSASFSMNVLSGFAQVFPNAPSESEGFLTVNLNPGGILHGWRFVGEQQWRASGVPVGGLTTGDRAVEFRPVPGYIHPPTEPLVSITSGGAARILERDYFETATTGSGGLSVILKPDSITTGTGRAQWRLLGESDAQWRDSGATLSGLIPGNYLIECKGVNERSTPTNTNVTLSDGQTASPTITYFLASTATGSLPSVLAYETVSTDTTKPYAYVGQIRSNVGLSSGFAVKERVVATAAHVVWDDGTLTAAQGLQWLFQRHRGTYEPEPVIPRGFYIVTGYDAQRRLEATPGSFSPQARNLDVAAMYFLTEAARTGYSGFLASDLNANEFLLSNANKMLVGYPIDGVASGSQGRMHATTPGNILFNAVGSTADINRVFLTTGIRSTGGASGGPLCVQFEGGNYYPAAIYLGGTEQTIVRAIDSTVIDLFTRAGLSSIDDLPHTSGGITHSSVSNISSTSSGSIRVLIEPVAARTGGAGWRLAPETSYRISGAQRSNLSPGNYILQMLPVAGFDTPATQTVALTAGQLNTFTYTYAAPLTPLETWRQTHFGSTANSGNGADTFDFDGDGFTNAQEYAAGTNPTLSGDFFKVTDSQRSGGNFSVSTSGKAGRTYTLQRSTNLTFWIAVGSPQGPLASDGAVTLQDAAMPNDAAFYRIEVTGP